jgi:DNA-binding MarR family transcriptional regulator
LAAWRAFLQAHRTVTAALANELEAVTGMSLAWYDVLVQLTEGGSLRMKQLADRVLLSRSGLTRLVDRLEVEGWVVRRASPEDARGFYVEITPAGTASLRRASVVHLRGVVHHFTRLLQADELEVIRRLMERLAATPSSVR